MIHRIKQATTSSSETIYPVKKYDLTNTITRINDQVHTKMCLDVANTLILDDLVPHFLTIELFSHITTGGSHLHCLHVKVIHIKIDYFL